MGSELNDTSTWMLDKNADLDVSKVCCHRQKADIAIKY